MKHKHKIYLISIIVFLLFATFVIVMVSMIKENSECVDNPFQYSAKKLKESGGNYYCYCRSLNISLLDFTFNEEKGIEIIRQNHFNMDNFNFTIEKEGGN